MILFRFSAAKHITCGVRYLAEFDENINCIVTASDDYLTLELTTVELPSFCYPSLVYDHIFTPELESNMEWLLSAAENKIICSVHAHLLLNILTTFDSHEPITWCMDIITRHLKIEQHVESKSRYKMAEIGLSYANNQTVAVLQNVQHLVLIKDICGFSQICRLLALDEVEHNTGYCTLYVKSTDTIYKKSAIDERKCNNGNNKLNQEYYEETNCVNKTDACDLLASINTNNTNNVDDDSSNNNNSSSNNCEECDSDGKNKIWHENSFTRNNCVKNVNPAKFVKSRSEEEEEHVVTKRYKSESLTEVVSPASVHLESKETILLTCTTETVATSLELGALCGTLPSPLSATARAVDLIKFTSLCDMVTNITRNRLCTKSQHTHKKSETNQEQLIIGFDISGIAMLRLQ